VNCSICGSKIKKSEAYFGDEGTFYEGKPLCETCYYEDELLQRSFMAKMTNLTSSAIRETRLKAISRLSGVAQTHGEAITKQKARTIL
jgi:hypothetical protein